MHDIRLLIGTIVMLLAYSSCTTLCGGAQSSTTQQVEGQNRPLIESVSNPVLESLIRELNHEDFQVRQAAESKIISDFGIEAIPLLKRFRYAQDGELRSRVNYLVEELDRMARAERISAFLAGTGSLEEWELAVEFIEATPAAREFFAKLVTDYRRYLMESSIDNATDRLEILNEIVEQIHGQKTVRGNDPQTQLARDENLFCLHVCLAIQLIRYQRSKPAREDELPDAILDRSIGSLFRRSTMVRSDLIADDFRDQLTPLLVAAKAAWVQLPAWNDPQNVAERLALARHHNMAAGLSVAEAGLGSMKDQLDGGAISDAILMLAKFGNTEHLMLLEQNLSDDMVVFDGRAINPETRRLSTYETTVGDVAQAAILHILEQPYREFGMNLLHNSTQSVLQPEQAGFFSDTTRAESRETLHHYLNSIRNSPDRTKSFAPETGNQPRPGTVSPTASCS